MTDAEKKPREWAIAPGYTVAIKNDFSWQDAKTWFQHQEGLNPERVIEFSAFQQAQEKIKQLEARVDKLREALEFYGDREETRESFDQLDWDLVNNNAALQDRGKRARAALKEDEESK